MSGQQEEADGLYLQHQYMCSECHQLFNTLEEVLVHQQSHTGLEGEDPGAAQEDITDSQDIGESQYQCLECGTLLRTPEELLLHQELHMRESGMEMEHHELCELVDSCETVTAPAVTGQIQYQCLDCLALFDTPEVWLAHRQTHNKSSTQKTFSDTEYVLQADGSVTPLVSVQNLVLSEQRAGEILNLAQALAAQQQASPLPPTPPRGALLPSASPLPDSATLRLQICTAQALADGSTGVGLRRAKLLPPLLPTCSPLESGEGVMPEEEVQRVEVGLAQSAEAQLGRDGEGEGDEGGEVVIIHPYECSECALLFQTPEDFLQHQGEHFLAQEKESGEEGVMEGAEDVQLVEAPEEEEAASPEENGSTGEEPVLGAPARSHRRQHSAFLLPRPRLEPAPPLSLQCSECQRTFTSANRLSAHRRVHEHGTHECPECDKVFKKPGSLQTHMRTHSGEARYLCMDCGHGFTTEMTLIIHRKSHTAEPLHRCQFCAKTFTNMTKFLYHRRTHTARAPLTPITMVSTAPQRVHLSQLSLLQRARELEESSPRETVVLAPGAEPLFIPPGQVQAEPFAALCKSDAGGTAVQPKQAGGENGLDTNHVPPQEAESREDAPKADANAASGPVPPNPASAVTEGSGAPPAPPRHLPFSCPSCSKSFSSQLCLVRHRRTVHVTERRFKCGICGKPFKKQIHVRNHLRVHTGERPFQCSDCGKTFSSLANLSRHGLTHSGLRPYRCEVCHKAFTQSSNLRQHSLLHANPAPFPCPDCPAAFLRPAKLAAHRYTQHPGAPAPFPCPHCPEGFLRKRQRDRHCLEAHPDSFKSESLSNPLSDLNNSDPTSEGPSLGLDGGASGSCGSAAVSRPALECTICGKRLNSAANLRLHQLSHGPRRRPGASAAAGRTKGHQCPLCGKLFVSSSSVALHQRVHTGERPFPCVQCGKRFRQNTHLREHLRTHSGERPFRCELCGKGFVQSMHLAEHRRTHTGERPHVCVSCGKAFKTFSNLRSHRKTHARAAPQEGPLTVVDTASVELAGAVPALCQQGESGQPQLIQIQTQQGENTPTIMCNEFGETIAIIETSEGGALPLAEAIEIYHTALENSLGMDSITVDSLQLL